MCVCVLDVCVCLCMLSVCVCVYVGLLKKRTCSAGSKQTGQDWLCNFLVRCVNPLVLQWYLTLS
jgi:hypothetical protein